MRNASCYWAAAASDDPAACLGQKPNQCVALRTYVPMERRSIDRHNEKETDRQRQTDKEAKADRQRGTERDIERQMETDRERQT